MRTAGLFFLLLAVINCGMVWPPPPEPARVELLYSFARPEDVQIEKGKTEKVFEFLFGRKKSAQDAFIQPQGIFSRDDLIYVTDPALACVHVYNLTKKEYFKINQAGAENLLSPVGVAADRSGKIYVSDSKLNKVLVFSPKGEFIKELGKGKFSRPCGIAVDSELDRIWVADTLDSAVKVFDLAGRFILRFGAKGAGKGEFNHPTYLAADKAGNLSVVDSLNFRVQSFSKEGKFLNAFGKMGRSPGSFSLPKGIALDSDGNIYVTDAAFDNVQIFSRQGKLLLFFGSPGNRAGEFWLPAGIAIDGGDKIYLADSHNGRVQVFRYIK